MREKLFLMEFIWQYNRILRECTYILDEKQVTHIKKLIKTAELELLEVLKGEYES